jgi:hypothetical protein
MSKWAAAISVGEEERDIATKRESCMMIRGLWNILVLRFAHHELRSYGRVNI